MFFRESRRHERVANRPRKWNVCTSKRMNVTNFGVAKAKLSFRAKDAGGRPAMTQLPFLILQHLSP
jgi:hypothetical protein